MEILIPEKIRDMVEEATITEVNDYLPKHITTEIDEIDNWNQSSDYPSIVVRCERDRIVEYEMQGIFKEYEIEILFLILSTESYSDSLNQRTKIKKRVFDKLISNHNLNNLSDNIKESVYNSRIEGTEFNEHGHEDGYTASALLTFIVSTEVQGPF